MLFAKLRRKRKPEESPKLHGEPTDWPTLRRYVLYRDQTCIAWRYDPVTHECRDRFGNPHRPDDTLLLSLGHVPDWGKNALQKKAPDDERHLVAICHGANVRGESRELRAFERGHLETVEIGTL